MLEVKDKWTSSPATLGSFDSCARLWECGKPCERGYRISVIYHLLSVGILKWQLLWSYLFVNKKSLLFRLAFCDILHKITIDFMHLPRHDNPIYCIIIADILFEILHVLIHYIAIWVPSIREVKTFLQKGSHEHWSWSVLGNPQFEFTTLMRW